MSDERTDAVRAAFAKACAAMPNPPSKSAGNYGKYCQLDDLMNHVRPVLAGEGLALTNELRSDVVAGAHEVVTVVTSVETGAQIEVGRVAFAAHNDAMKAGGSVTYYRRFSVMAACGVAGDDDVEQAPAKPARRPAKASNDQPSTARPAGQISPAQVKALQTRYSGMERAERLASWTEQIGRPVTTANDLTKVEAITLLTDEGAGHV